MEAFPYTRKAAPLPGKGVGLKGVDERENFIYKGHRPAACHVGAEAERHSAPCLSPEIESGAVVIRHHDRDAPAAYSGNMYDCLQCHISKHGYVCHNPQGCGRPDYSLVWF